MGSDLKPVCWLNGGLGLSLMENTLGGGPSVGIVRKTNSKAATESFSLNKQHAANDNGVELTVSGEEARHSEPRPDV